LPQQKTNFQSDPLWQLKSKIIITNYEQLSRAINNKKHANKRKFLEYVNFANNYYRPLNYKKLRNIT